MVYGNNMPEKLIYIIYAQPPNILLKRLQRLWSKYSMNTHKECVLTAVDGDELASLYFLL